MSQGRCIECRYYHSPPSLLTECRRYPPTMWDKLSAGPKTDLIFFWPQVSSTDHCGEFAPIETTSLLSLIPYRALAGSPGDFEMVATGDGFDETSVIVWDGKDMPTRLISPVQVSTICKPSEVPEPTTAQVQVRTKNKLSNQKPFHFLADIPADVSKPPPI